MKPVEVREPKKRGRKPKAVEPVINAVAEHIKPLKKEKIAKVKAEKKPVVKPKLVRKPATKAKTEPSVKPVPIAANKANTTVAKPKKEKVAKVKADKPIMKEEKMKVAATVESVVSSLLTTAPKKEVAKVVKKKAPKKRTKGFVRLAPLGKPLTKKVVDEPAPIEPIAPAEQS